MTSQRSFNTPPVVMNLIIINVLFFMAEALLPNGMGNALINKLALYYWESPNFQVYQYVSYMFLHGDISHLFFNMFALWMFGRTIEHDMGSKRFLIYYFVTGIGAGLIQMGVTGLEVAHIRSLADSAGAVSAEQYMSLMQKINIPSIGASGAVFGILLAFGMMYPNSILMLIFPPIRMKAKYFVIIYGVIELFLGISGKQSGVAHFAHLGGMIFGFFLLKYWKKKGYIYF